MTDHPEPGNPGAEAFEREDVEPEADEEPSARLDRLQAQVAILSSRIDLFTTLVTGGDDLQTSTRRTWVWSSLTAAEASLAWAHLTGWVDQLVARYGLHEAVPACWYAHPPLVEELSALRAAWLAAYHPRAKPDQAAVWHDVLDRVLTRVRGWNRTGCAGTHRPEPPLTPHEDDAADRRSYIAADLEHRAGRLRDGEAPDG